MMRWYHAGNTQGRSEWSSLWLRTLLSLLLLARPAIALSLERAVTVNAIFFLHGNLPYFLMYSLQKSVVIESQSQQGLWGSLKLHVHATHKQGQDSHIWPLQLIYAAGIQKHQFHCACCVKHPTEPWPRWDVKGYIHGTVLYPPGLLMGGSGDTVCYDLKEPALVPPESPHLLTFCLNFQPVESLLWVKEVFPQPFFPFSTKNSF